MDASAPPLHQQIESSSSLLAPNSPKKVRTSAQCNDHLLCHGVLLTTQQSMYNPFTEDSPITTENDSLSTFRNAQHGMRHNQCAPDGRVGGMHISQLKPQQCPCLLHTKDCIKRFSRMTLSGALQQVSSPGPTPSYTLRASAPTVQQSGASHSQALKQEYMRHALRMDSAGL